MKKEMQIFMYPIIEVILFFGAYFTWELSSVLSLTLLILSSVFFNYTVHVFSHEVAHKTNWCEFKPLRRGCESLVSLLLGLSFNSYRLGHYNHHEYCNQLGDLTSTWKFVDGKPKAKNRWAYAFLWPINLVTHPPLLLKEVKAGRLDKEDWAWILPETILVLLTVVILFVMSPVLGGLYFMLVYLGWSFTSLMNFGQHPPADYSLISNNYLGKNYNAFFYNNGLHYEHHVDDSIPTSFLKPTNRKIEIKVNQLWAGLFSKI